MCCTSNLCPKFYITINKMETKEAHYFEHRLLNDTKNDIIFATPPISFKAKKFVLSSKFFKAKKLDRWIKKKKRSRTREKMKTGGEFMFPPPGLPALEL